jgi:hypothetical protein
MGAEQFLCRQQKLSGKVKEDSKTAHTFIVDHQRTSSEFQGVSRF